MCKRRLLPFALLISFVMVFSLFGCQAVAVPAGSSGNPAAATDTPAGATGTPAGATGTAVDASAAAASAGTAATEPEEDDLAAGSYTVSLDVNPSVELTVVDGVVTKVTAYNDDATQLLLKVDVTGLPTVQATKKLVAALAAEGYINNAEIKPYLLISVYNAQEPDSGLTKNLKKIAGKALDELNVKCDVGTTNVAADTLAKAEALGMSIGRYMIFDFIAKKEGITIEEAVAKYGALKITELMRLYDGMDKIFDGSKSDTEDAGPLTPEQKAAVEAAKAQFHASIKAAEEAYVKAKNAAIRDLKAKWKELKAQYKENRNSQEFKQAKNALRESYRATRIQIHTAFRQAYEDARKQFLAALSGIGLTDGQMDKLLDYKVKDGVADDSDKYLTDDPEDDADEVKKEDDENDKESGQEGKGEAGGDREDKNKVNHSDKKDKTPENGRSKDQD